MKDCEYLPRVGELLSGPHIQTGTDSMSDESTIRIPLVHGGEAIIDASDRAAVEGYRWRRVRRWSLDYAVASTTRDGVYTCVFMHRVILGLTKGDGIYVDHANHDGLDNRRQNIRLATPRQNAANSRKRPGTKSAFIGAYFAAGRWAARIELPGRSPRLSVALGRFDKESEAAFAYRVAAKMVRDTAFLCLTPIPRGELPDRSRLREIRADARRRIESAHSGKKVRANPTTEYHCVYMHRPTGKWHFMFRHDRRTLNLGPFRSDHEAAFACNYAWSWLGRTDKTPNVIPEAEQPDPARSLVIRAAVDATLKARLSGIKGALPNRFMLSRNSLAGTKESGTPVSAH